MAQKRERQAVRSEQQIVRRLFSHAKIGEEEKRCVREFLVSYGYLPPDFNDEQFKQGLVLARDLLLPGLNPGSKEFLAALALLTGAPRCGVRDADSGRVLQGYRLDFVNALPFTLRYWITPTPPDGVTLAAMRATLRSALLRWHQVEIGQTTIVNFEETSVRREAHIKFLWTEIDGIGSRIADAMPAELGEDRGIIRFDSLDSWTAVENLDDFHIGTIALHEIGHSLGLAHIFDPPDPKPTMDPNFDQREDLSLEDIDIKTLRDIYSHQ